MKKSELRKIIKEEISKVLKEEVISKYIEEIRDEGGGVYEDFKIDMVKDYISSKYGADIAEEFLSTKEWEDSHYAFFDVDEVSTDGDVEEFLDREVEFYYGEELMEMAGLTENVVVNEAMKFAEDLAPIIASELVEKGIVKQASDVETILLDILEKVGKENNYTI